MLRVVFCVVVLVTGLTACAHHGAVRAACDGVLRPINPPAQGAPVTVTAPESAPAPEPHP